MLKILCLPPFSADLIYGCPLIRIPDQMDSLADNGLGVDGVAVDDLDPAVLGEAEVVGLDVAQEQPFLEDRVQLLR